MSGPSYQEWECALLSAGIEAEEAAPQQEKLPVDIFRNRRRLATLLSRQSVTIAGAAVLLKMKPDTVGKIVRRHPGLFLRLPEGKLGVIEAQYE